MHRSIHTVRFVLYTVVLGELSDCQRLQLLPADVLVLV